MRLLYRVPAAAALCTATVIAGGCTADRGADLGAAGYLADRADVLAERIGDGEPCGAVREGEMLVERAWATVSSGELSASTAAHVEEVVAEVVGDLRCEPSDTDISSPDDARSALEAGSDAGSDAGTPVSTDEAATDDTAGSRTEQADADDDSRGGTPSRGDGTGGRDEGGNGGGEDASAQDTDPPGRGGDAPGRGGDPPGRGSDPPGRGGDPPAHGGDPPGRSSDGDAPRRGNGRGR